MEETPLTVADDLVVSMAYVLRLEDGHEIDRSEPGEPLEFLQGNGQIIPGLESALYGMAVGEEKLVIVSPAEGYGEYNPENVVIIPRSAFPPAMKVAVGETVYLQEDGTVEQRVAFIDEVGDESVKVNLNHPLAGETMVFEITIAGLRQATAEELDHGHVHGDGHAH